jgi:hypothetical protein
MDRSTDDRPGVSVVLPCYNSHRYLQKTLDSLRAQTYRDFEMILVDDGSDDPDTLAFIDSLADDVQVLRQPNSGLAAARNTGILHAKGDYVLPLDCDDWLDPAFLEKAHERIEGLPEGQFVFCHMALRGDMSGQLGKSYNFFEQLFLNQLPYCLLMPRKIWMAFGGYDETMRHGYEDWEFNIRLGNSGVHGVAIAEPLFNYRVSDTGMLRSVSRKRHGGLWRDIQRRNRSAYGWRNLLRSYRSWRGKPSTYPLPLYFFWLTLFKVLPLGAFNMIFFSLMRFSHSARVSGSAHSQGPA